MRQLRHSLRHLLNPLHVYCRLVDTGLARPRALRLSRAYERFLFRYLPL